MRKLLSLAGCLLIGMLSHPLFAQELDYPNDVFDPSLPDQGHCVSVLAGFPDPVDPTGVQDSTKGIQDAINYLYVAEGTDVPRQLTLYFPNGTYLISGTLDGLWTGATTGNTTSGSKSMTNVASMTGIKVGNSITCTDFPGGTTVSMVNTSTNTITLSKTSTGTHTGIAITLQSNIYRLHFVGQSESGVTLTLGNAVTGFTNRSTPKAMIKTESDGAGNNAFDNCIWNMTLNTGTNNPGAEGIDYLGNNCASIRHVKITGAGYAGIAMTRAYPGPCMLENIEVDNAAYGILMGQSSYCATIDTLNLNNITSSGVTTSGNSVYINNLASTNTIAGATNTVVSNGVGGFVVLLNSSANYSGGGKTIANAIVNSSSGTNSGGAFIRNFTSSNYSNAVYNPNTGGSNTTGNAADGYVSEYSTHPVLTPGLAGSLTNSLNLPIAATPYFTDNNTNNWYNITSMVNGTNVIPDAPFLSPHLPDESSRIQAAIDVAATNGCDTVYFPPGKYYVASPVYLHGGIRRVLGFGSVLMPFVPSTGTGAFDSTHANNATNLQPIIGIGGGPLGDVNNSVEIDQFDVFATTITGQTAYYNNIQQNTTNSVTLSDMELTGGALISPTQHFLVGSAYQATQPGNLFLDDVTGANWLFTQPGQQIWGRQVDPEGDTLGIPSTYQAKITNSGATLWILGLKTEDFGTLVESTSNAQTEVLGAFAYSVHTPGTEFLQTTLNNNLFDVQNSDFSGCYATYGGSGNLDYPNQVGETEGGPTAILYNYSSTNSPTAYLRKETIGFSMAPSIVAVSGLGLPGADIGSVGPAGTGSFSGGTYTISGSGIGVGGTADAFHFCSENIMGDCTVTAEVTSLPYVTSTGVAGVMIRDTSAANSDMVFCTMNKTSTSTRAEFTVRSTTGGTVVQAIQSGLTIPYWVQLQRTNGTNFAAYSSPTGLSNSWTQVGGSHVVNMSSSAPMVGLGASSGTTSQLSTNTFSNESITSP